MSYPTYKIVHLVGLALLYAAIGGLLFASRRPDGRPPKSLTALHGIGALLMLVGGFGLLARLEVHWPWPLWVLIKVAVWGALGALPFALRRLPGAGSLRALVVLTVAVGLAGLAVGLAQYKPT